MIKKILLVLLLALIVIQFIHPKKNKTDAPQPNYIGNKFPVPQDVNAILVKACNDCHSNNTRYPWYSKLQPVHWWLDKHIRNGKRHLNYDEYTNKSAFDQYHKMDETIEMVEDGAMPLNSYTWTHKDAKLTADEKAKLIAWANGVKKQLEGIYHKDSLVRPKK